LNNEMEPQVASLYQACQDFARYIAKARNEIAGMRPHELKQKRLPRAGEELETIVRETESATNIIMAAAEEMLSLSTETPEAFKIAVDERSMRIIEACSFQDITGQRIRKVVGTLTFIEERLARLHAIWGPDIQDADGAPEDQPQGDAALMHGPQLHGEGVDQSGVDELFASAPTPMLPPAAASAPDQAAAPKLTATKALAPKPTPTIAAPVSANSQADIDAMFD
jgi:chemotaxis protein CheZ